MANFVRPLAGIGASMVLMAATTGVAVASESSSSGVGVYTCGFQAAPWCALALTNVNQRAQPTSKSAYIATISKGDAFELWCYSEGETINGDNIWYYGSPNVEPPYRPEGWVTGYWLDGGHDPAPQIRHC
ncbi:hypothetical protein [Amycolatopsis sp. DG1A-15b]|uniref:hypothetical protein n=1 Tax=Amycolatopsis sp. DG1A-15b TaxID=3052846 RepID=UPI00255BE509|nr:hypothetical protein [Amycolatopsis sp. DG1A-15b]WIX86350.1 hypothetical protein QRY02_34900 [Amycolatopsis sp. DG1A-15b]